MAKMASLQEESMTLPDWYIAKLEEAYNITQGEDNNE
jgi:hypothetical protein